MTNNIVINDKNRTIEITKKFANDAKIYGTAAYEDLKAVRNDFPRYRVVIKSVKKGDCFKGLTADYIKNYICKKVADREEEIKKGDDPEVKNEFKDLLKEFYTLRGLKEDGEEKDDLAVVVSYGELKEWFLIQFPEVKTQRKAVDKILENARKKKVA